MTIYVIGKLRDVLDYRDAPGYSTFTPIVYDHAENIRWLQSAIERGEWIQAVSHELTGVYREEYRILETAMGPLRVAMGHTGGMMADHELCPKCGAQIEIHKYYGETCLEEEWADCLYCGWYWQYSYGNYDEGYRAEFDPAGPAPVDDIPF